MSIAYAILLILLGGLASGFQPPVNAGLAAYVRPLPAAFISFVTGTILLCILTYWSMRGRSLAEFGTALASAPLWAYFGGMLGVVAVTAMIFGTPVLGASSTISLFIFAQITAALLIDTYGLVGRPALPLGWPQILGVLLIAGGARLVLWR